MEFYDQVDYYQVLGVPPDADREVIKQAFRARARVCHPDCGGSHTAMQLVNLAWDILSDPVQRERYDQARREQANHAAQAAAAADYRAAAHRAADYPAEAEELEDWLNDLTNDFKNAQYGSTDFWGVNVPTVSGSVSGPLFIIVGGLLGLLIAVLVGGLLLSLGLKPIGGTGVRISLIVVACLISGGAWLGSKLHSGIGQVLFNAPPGNSPSRPKRSVDPIRPPGQFGASSPSRRSTSRKRRTGAATRQRPSPVFTMPPQTQSQTRQLTCPSCQQRLNVPAINAELAVTCTACHCRFPCPPQPPI